jgi:hypothetical protein
MIRKALGLGLMILILKFLMSEVFSAGEKTLVEIFNTASAIIPQVGTNGLEAPDVSSLIPR